MAFQSRPYLHIFATTFASNIILVLKSCLRKNLLLVNVLWVATGFTISCHEIVNVYPQPSYHRPFVNVEESRLDMLHCRSAIAFKETYSNLKLTPWMYVGVYQVLFHYENNIYQIMLSPTTKSNMSSCGWKCVSSSLCLELALVLNPARSAKSSYDEERFINYLPNKRPEITLHLSKNDWMSW